MPNELFEYSAISGMVSTNFSPTWGDTELGWGEWLEEAGFLREPWKERTENPDVSLVLYHRAKDAEHPFYVLVEVTYPLDSLLVFVRTPADLLALFIYLKPLYEISTLCRLGGYVEALERMHQSRGEWSP